MDALALFGMLLGSLTDSRLSDPYASLRTFPGITTPMLVQQMIKACTVALSVTTPRGRGLGSGVLIHPSGLILTNDHVIDGMNLEVVFMDYVAGRSEVRHPATPLQRWRSIDTALIQSQPIPPYFSHCNLLEAISGDRAQEGTPTNTIGHPLVASQRRMFESTQGNVLGYINYPGFGAEVLVIDAQTHPGNSGGPVFDQTGQLVGLQFWNPTLSWQGSAERPVTFAVPSFVFLEKIRPFLATTWSTAQDPYRYRQYHFNLHKLEALRGNGDGVRIGVIDGGFVEHPDLKGVFDRTRGTRVFSDGTFGPIENNNAPFHHATWVNGLIAAPKNNIGVEGVAPAATIIPVQVFDDHQLTGHATAIEYLTGLKPDIILIEEAVQGTTLDVFQPEIKRAIDLATEMGIVVVLPTGQETNNFAIESPYSQGSSAVYVAGPSPINHWGSRIDVVAVAGATTAIESDGKVHYPIVGAASSSLAAAVVTGAIARIKETCPALTPGQIRQLLRDHNQRLFRYKSPKIGPAFPQDLGTYLDGQKLQLLLDQHPTCIDPKRQVWFK